MKESERIQKVLDDLDSRYADDGIIHTVLRERIIQEKEREQDEKEKGD